MLIKSVIISLQGRAILGIFLSERISNDVTGVYIPPFYKLAEVAMPEVGTCILYNHSCKSTL